MKFLSKCNKHLDIWSLNLETLFFEKVEISDWNYSVTSLTLFENESILSSYDCKPVLKQIDYLQHTNKIVDLPFTKFLLFSTAVVFDANRRKCSLQSSSDTPLCNCARAAYEDESSKFTFTRNDRNQNFYKNLVNTFMYVIV